MPERSHTILKLLPGLIKIRRQPLLLLGGLSPSSSVESPSSWVVASIDLLDGSHSAFDNAGHREKSRGVLMSLEKLDQLWKEAFRSIPGSSEKQPTRSEARCLLVSSGGGGFDTCAPMGDSAESS